MVAIPASAAVKARTHLLLRTLSTSMLLALQLLGCT